MDKRVKNVIAMDEVVTRLFNDEDNIMTWLSLGCPDQATLEDYEFIASSDEDYEDIVNLFTRLVAEELKRLYDQMTAGIYPPQSSRCIIKLIGKDVLRSVNRGIEIVSFSGLTNS